MKESLNDFLARQLNDHAESQRGVKQPTYHTWNENHIADAITMGSALLFSLIPQEFSTLKNLTLEEPACIVSFCNDCSKFLGLADTVTINGEECIDLEEDETDTNSLISMLAIDCAGDDGEEETQSSYGYEILDGSNCTVKFSTMLPAGTTIPYFCAEFPDDIENGDFDEYLPIIAEYAAHWLFRTDSESRSSMTRAAMHLQTLIFIVRTKLGIEFSLTDEGDVYDLRKVSSQ